MTQGPELLDLDPRRLSAVLFDYDDTLVMTREHRWEAIREAGREAAGWAPSMEEIERFWGLPYQTFFERLFDGRTTRLESVIAAYESLNDRYPAVPHEGALEALARIGRTRRIGIVTAGARSVVLAQLRSLGLDPRSLDWLQTAEDSEHHKPDPRVFAKALAKGRECDLAPSELLYVGDAFTDYAAARDAGLAFVGIPRVEAQRAKLCDAGAICVESLGALARFLCEDAFSPPSGSPPRDPLA